MQMSVWPRTQANFGRAPRHFSAKALPRAGAAANRIGGRVRTLSGCTQTLGRGSSTRPPLSHTTVSTTSHAAP